MSQREDFEEVAARMGYWLRMRNASSEDGEYMDQRTQDVWDMWQEAHDLYTQPQSAVPVGWKLVPIGPTLKMIAALAFGGDEDLVIGHAAIAGDVECAYRAMLGAAPQPHPQSVE